MGRNTRIPWCDHSHNFWTGCHKVSAGCAHCYMHTVKRRWGKDPELVTRTSDATFYAPLKWDKAVLAKATGMMAPKLESVFCNSWSDFFIEEADRPEIGRGWRDDAWSVIFATPHLRWLILTKRAQRIRECLPGDWGNGWPHAWLGVTAENQAAADERIPLLLHTPATVRFVSLEPLLASIDLSAYLSCELYAGPLIQPSVGTISGKALPAARIRPRLDWIICGSETGPGARPSDPAWVESLIGQCRVADVPVWIKGKLHDGFPITMLPGDRWPEEVS